MGENELNHYNCSYLNKKMYIKPDIKYESFITNSYISSCNLKALTADNQCGGFDTNLGIGFFTMSLTGCDLEPLDYNNICYHNVSDSTTIFGS